MADVKNTKKTARDYVYAVGRRREAVARVRVYKSNQVQVFGNDYKLGDVVINGKHVTEYFRFPAAEPVYKKLFELTDTQGKYIVTAKVEGGGINGQLDAFLHGLARAFDKMNTEKFHSLLRDNGYLTRDARVRERRKVGTGGKARRQKQSPKR